MSSNTRAAVARELIRRKRCRDSLHSFACSIDIPTAPRGAILPDEDLTGPASSLLAPHHSLILGLAQRVITKPGGYGRGLVMAPPGTAKSTYVSVVVPPWALGREDGQRIILTSYGSDLAHRQSRRARQICASQLYRDIWTQPLTVEKDADKEWGMSNRSELLAAGLLAGITGSRANGAIIDDPVAGREEADSPSTRSRTLGAYQDDLLTRILPGGWIILIMTRWNEQDLAGEILPLDYKGQSGIIQCRDGMDWDVLNLPAKAEHLDDPLGRKPGEYIWTDYYPARHWQMFENGVGPERQRTWSSLYQQRPTPQGSGQFTREMIRYYDELPDSARKGPKVFTGDFAVSVGKNDFTEMGVWALDHDDNLYPIDWFFEQCDTGKGVDKMIELGARHNCRMGFNEGGVIDKAIRPAYDVSVRGYNAKARKEGRAPFYMDLRAIPSMADKMAKLSAFQARCANGKVFWPRTAWAERVINQLLSMPAARWDDGADNCGLIGRGLDQFRPPAPSIVTRKDGIKPYTAAWIEYQEDTKPAIRYR